MSIIHIFYILLYDSSSCQAHRGDFFLGFTLLTLMPDIINSLLAGRVHIQHSNKQNVRLHPGWNNSNTRNTLIAAGPIGFEFDPVRKTPSWLEVNAGKHRGVGARQFVSTMYNDTNFIPSILYGDAMSNCVDINLDPGFPIVLHR